MKISKTKLNGLVIIQPDIFEDERGYFLKTFNCNNLDFTCREINNSFSKSKGILRGIHFQNNPHNQKKIVRCVKGSILDVIVDLRKYSPTYKEWISVELSPKNRKQVMMDKGFGHGFLTLEDNTEVEYVVNDFYTPEVERTIKFDDPDLAIDWGIDNPIVSDRDKNAPFLKDCDIKL